MGTPPPTPTRNEALAIVRGDRRRLLALVDRLPSRALSRTGLAGGDWSPKDLIGHLESWEEHALEAMAAWEQGRRAAIDGDLKSVGVDGVNAREIERKKATPARQAFDRAARTHASLIEAIKGIDDARWDAPVRGRGGRSLGVRIGNILGGPEGLFKHDRAHLGEVKAFVARHGG
jgi:DinB superfamily